LFVYLVILVWIDSPKGLFVNGAKGTSVPPYLDYAYYDEQLVVKSSKHVEWVLVINEHETFNL
jgi:hypothetical protein